MKKNRKNALLLFFLFQIVFGFQSFSYTVTQLTGLYQNGQVFLTWQNPGNLNLQYNVYRSTTPFTTSSQLTSSTFLGYVRDSSGMNVRKTLLNTQNQTYYYVITNGQSPLASDRGLYVVTCSSNNTYYYAVTVTNLSTNQEAKSITMGSNSLSTGISETVAMPKPVLQTITNQTNGDISYEYVFFGNNQELPHWHAFNNLGSYGYNFSVQTRGNATNQPLFVDFQDANPFAKLDNDFCSNCNMLQLDDRLPNGQGTYWIGYNDSYNMYMPNDSNPIVTSGKVHTYSQSMTQAIIRWTKRQAGIDSNRIYMTGQSHNGFGCMLTAMNMPTEIACIYNVLGPVIYKTQAGDPREHQLCLSTANIPTDVDYPGTNDSMLIWSYTNLRNYYRVNTAGIAFAQSINGKNDLTVGWIQKFHWYDSLNKSRQGGIWYWDQRTHGGSGANFITEETTPTYTRYYANRSYPAFSYCSINHNPGNGIATNGDPYGTINGYLDWYDNSIADLPCSYGIKCFVKNLYVGGVLDSRQFDSCTTDISFRRTQQFHPANGETITWTNYGANNQLLQSGSFVYNGGLITLTGIKIKRTGSTISLLNTNAVLTTYYADADADGYGNASVSTQGCSNPTGYVTNNGDCNDANAAIRPGIAEVCNGIDDNCSGQIDEGVKTTFYANADGDGYGNVNVTTLACSVPSGYVSNSTDCNDANANIYPGAPELLNSVDDNCNGQVDELTTFYADADGDGYGNANVTTQGYTAPLGYVGSNTDCNDANANIRPNASETCNGIDDNCSGQIDEGVKTTFYADADGDSYGSASVTTQACSVPSGYVSNNTDCNDANANIRPNASETCNGIDDNCSGQVDEGVKTTFYADTDGDSYGSASVTTQACSVPSGYVSNNTDCNDANSAIRPGATEVCNAIDDNCNGQVDDGVVTANVTPSGTVTICSGADVTLSVNTGSGRTYQWKKNDANVSGATGSSYVASVAATYKVVVTQGGCSGTSAVTTLNINILPIPSIATSTGATTFCSNSGVYLTTTTTGAYSYSWYKGSALLTGATSQNYTATSSGTYKVQITDGLGCTAKSAGLAVTVNAAPSPTITGSAAFCQGQSTTLSANTTYASYTWSTGVHTQSITVSNAATYTLSVTDANGCTGTSPSRTTTINSLPTPTITAAGPVSFCSGGSVSLTVTATYSTYNWSNGSTGQTHSFSSSGTYFCTVTDNNSCTGSSNSIVVTEYIVPVPVVTTSNGPATFCSNSGVYLTTSTTGYNYSWYKGSALLTGATNQNYTPTSSGTYKVQLNDSHGCTAIATGLAITVNTAPSPTITGTTSICQGQSTTLSANTTYSSYTWSTGVHTQSISVSNAATYTLTVTDANGCTGTSPARTTTVNSLPTPTISASGATSFCSGGSVTLSVNNTYNSYSWTGGATSQSKSYTASGTYSCTVTDANSCTATSNAITVSVHTVPVPTVTTSNGPATFCSNSGVYLTTSTTGYNYSWYKGSIALSGATNQNYTPTANGTYKVQLTDAYSCTALSSGLAITINAAPAPTITGSSSICQGNSTTLSANTTYSSYTWSTGAHSQSITTSSAGTYTLTVTNSSGCTGVAPSITTTVYSNPTATITITGSTNFCDGGNVILTANNATTYSWSDGKTTQANTVTASGTFTVTITDSHGCTAISAPVTANEHILPNPVVTAVGSTTYCVGSSGNYLTTSANGYNYQWKKGTVNVSGATTENYQPALNGTYKVQITDNIGCSRTTTTGVAVTANALPTASVTYSGNTNLCGGATATLVESTQSGNTYQWKNGSSTISGATGSQYITGAAGSYKCQVTKSNGCTNTSNSITLTNNCKIEDSESFDDAMQSVMNVYPNPATNDIHIDVQFASQLNGEALLEIHNMLGQIVYSEKQEIKEGKFSTNILFDQRFSDGSFFTRICFNDDCITKQFLITASGK